MTRKCKLKVFTLKFSYLKFISCHSFYMDTTVVPKEHEFSYLRDTMLGGRQYCLKEPLSTLKKARMQLTM